VDAHERARERPQDEAGRLPHLFSREGRRALREVLAGSLLVAFDFDGTLAPIVEHPDDARVPAALVPLLASLSRFAPVAVITGRRVADVTTRLDFSPWTVVGNHGAEGLDLPGSRSATNALAGLRQSLERGRSDLDAAGVMVEDKGQSLAFHYRLATNIPAALAAIDRVLASLDQQVSRFEGKCVVNIVAANAPDKADALEALAARADVRSVIFVGDDVNDETVFRRGAPGWLTIRVGRDDPHSRAAFFLDDHREMATLLRIVLSGLARRHGRKGPA